MIEGALNILSTRTELHHIAALALLETLSYYPEKFAMRYADPISKFEWLKQVTKKEKEKFEITEKNSLQNFKITEQYFDSNFFFPAKFIYVGEPDDKENFGKIISLVAPLLPQHHVTKVLDELVSEISPTASLDKQQGSLATIGFLLARLSQKKFPLDQQQIKLTLFRLLLLLSHSNVQIVNSAIQVCYSFFFFVAIHLWIP